MTGIPEKLRIKLEKRKSQDAYRRLQNRGDLADFSSNDYLGFARIENNHPKEFADGSTGSRLISGNHELHEKAERTIAEFHNAEAALIFNSGYDANLGLLPALFDRNDYVFYDASVHASLRDGMMLGNAKNYKYDHNNLESLKKRVRQVLGKAAPVEGSEVYVITETVFSMEGDGPDIGPLALYCKEQGFRLILDEAHAVGILGPQGRGAVVEAGVSDLVFARIVTFGKALGCHGAAILGSTLLREYLINYSRSFIYTTALPPSSIFAILKAYERLTGPEGVQARKRLNQNKARFISELGARQLTSYFHEALAAIYCCEIGGNVRVKGISSELGQAGYNVKPILSPTVPKGHECLRFSLHAYNRPEEITGVLTILEKSLKNIKV